MLVIRTALPHVDLVVPDQNVPVDHSAAFRADTSDQFVKHVVCILLGIGFRREGRAGIYHRYLANYLTRNVLGVAAIERVPQIGRQF